MQLSENRAEGAAILAGYMDSFEMVFKHVGSATTGARLTPSLRLPLGSLHWYS